MTLPDELPEEPEELSEELLQCLVALVKHPRLKEYVRERAQDLSPSRLTSAAVRLHQAEQVLLEQWPAGAGLQELRAAVLERIADTVSLAIDEMEVVAVLEGDADTLHPAQQLLRKATFLLVGLLERLPFEDFLDDDLNAPPDERDAPGSDGERDWLH